MRFREKFLPVISDPPLSGFPKMPCQESCLLGKVRVHFIWALFVSTEQSTKFLSSVAEVPAQGLPWISM